MALISGNYPSFLGGESQQDDTVRSPSQVWRARNAWLHAAKGAGKRPPAEYVAGLGHDTDPDSHFHSIIRDEVERYLVVIGHRRIRVFDHVTGQEYTVNVTGNALDYLDTQGQRPWSMFATATVSDSTFIVNRSVRVQEDPAPAPGFLHGSVQTMSDLPKGAAGNAVPGGAIYAVVGSDQSPFDDYYVQKQSSQVWQECARPGIPCRVNRFTMPHVLKRIPDPVHADGFWFSFGAPEWTERGAGDTESNPFPSFTGQPIRDVFVHRDRLGFLSGENVLLSETSDYFNFWRTSVTSMLDSDPIDVSVVAGNGVATLYHAVPFQSSLYLATSSGQITLTSEPYLAAKYVKTSPITNYGISPWVRPKLMGESLYFVDDTGAHASVREYYMDDQATTGAAADVTSHVPVILQGRVRAFAPSTDAGCVFFAPDTPNRHQLYVYFVRWGGDEKQQSAWARWSLSGVGKIVHLHTIADDVYAVAQTPEGGCELVRFRMSLIEQPLLDRHVTVTPHYQAFGNQTWIDLPYAVQPGQPVTVLKTADWPDANAYLSLPSNWTLDNGGTRLVLPGNHAGGRVIVGLDYEHRLTLTRALVRDEHGNALKEGRTQLRDIEVAYNSAAYFEMEVAHHGQNRTETYLASHSGAYTARVLGSSEFVLSSPVVHSGSRRFPILGNAANVQLSLLNTLPYQCWFQSAQWRGTYVPRSRR